MRYSSRARQRLVLLFSMGSTAGALTACQTSSGPAAPPAPTSLTSYDARVDELLSGMTLAEKIGQMTQVDQEFLADAADIENYHLGSLLSGGNSDPRQGNTLQAWTDLYDRLQQRTQNTRLRIPLLYGIDAVHGHSNVLGAVIFPHNIGLGATRNPELVRRIAEITAKEVRATGINWTFAPCVCVPRDERWGRTYEGFSEDPELVAELGAAAVRGYQGATLTDPLAVLASAKHYAGDGGTSMGTGGPQGRGLDQGDARIDEATMRRIHIRPYETALAAGVGSIMPSYNSWNGQKVSGHKYLLTDLLKGELGFEGFLISDYRAVNQLDPDYKTAIAKSINAGMDMVMVPDAYREFIEHLTALVNEGTVPQSRVDDAVRRILRVKFAMGLMDGAPLTADRSLHAAFGSAGHRDVARQAVRESIVLLKNERNTMPLSKRAARIHVAGKNADNLGHQTGGWTIDWQGGTGDVTTGGTTVLAAIRKAVSPNTNVTFTSDGTGAAGADFGIVVIGETAYAEGNGDTADLSLAAEDAMAIRNVEAAGIPVVVVLISGRPMILGESLDLADAFLAAWLPGSEGDGVADVLFGDYRPTGKLSFTWPRSMEQLPINLGDGKGNPLFAYGHGLTY